jgi:chitinase
VISSALMNFDLYGAWSTTTGLVLPNSPLNGTCPSVPLSAAYSDGSPSLEALPISAYTAVGSWALSGFRNDQIVLGVSSSGRSYRVTTDHALITDEEYDGYGELVQYPPFLTSDISSPDSNATITDLGDEWWLDDTSNSTSTNATCDISNLISTISGVYTFQGLIDAGFLDDYGDVVSCIAEDDTEIVGGWDECSETPFVYNTKTGVMVSYDDSESMGTPMAI